MNPVLGSVWGYLGQVELTDAYFAGESKVSEGWRCVVKILDVFSHGCTPYNNVDPRLEVKQFRFVLPQNDSAKTVSNDAETEFKSEVLEATSEGQGVSSFDSTKCFFGRVPIANSTTSTS